MLRDDGIPKLFFDMYSRRLHASAALQDVVLCRKLAKIVRAGRTEVW